MRLKLTLAFLFTSVVGVVLVAGAVRWFTFTEFNNFVLEDSRATFIENVTSYYETNGASWEGIERTIQHPLPNVERLAIAGSARFVLVDQEGSVRIPFDIYQMGEKVSREVLADGETIEVDGDVIGWVLTTENSLNRDPRQEQYLARTNRAVLIAGLWAAAVGLGLGLVLAQRLARPIYELTLGIRALASGTPQPKVPVRSRDELGELAAAFNQLSADLARANYLRRQMTADIAHDLRSPLTVIIGYLETLRDGVLSPTPDRFDTIFQEAQHLQRLIEDLRLLSLADAGELVLNRQSIHPRTLLERVAAAYQLQSQQRQINIEVATDAAVSAIQVDVERMVTQVLGNLVSNALRYTPMGGQITLAAIHQPDTTILSVKDTGKGIEPTKLPYIFERFYRADSARQEQGESGLGLAIAKSIVEAHGGTIRVQSIVDYGTRFEIFIPMGRI